MIYIYRILWVLFYIPVYLLQMILFIIAIPLYFIMFLVYYIKDGNIDNAEYLNIFELICYIDDFYKDLQK